MNNISLRKLFLFIFILLLAIGSCNAQIFHRNPERQLFAKKKQEANDRKLKRDYDKSIRRSQKRTIDIQTPEVQKRMKQNKKDYTSRDKEKRKNLKATTRRAGKKYKE